MEPFIKENPAEARYSTEIDWRTTEREFFNYMGVIGVSVTKAKVIARDNAHFIVDLPTEQYINLSEGIDGRATEEPNLDIPCIMGLFPQEHARQHKHFIMCVDGHNRIRKAHKEGKAWFRAIILTAEETQETRN